LLITSVNMFFCFGILLLVEINFTEVSLGSPAVCTADSGLRGGEVSSCELEVSFDVGIDIRIVAHFQGYVRVHCFVNVRNTAEEAAQFEVVVTAQEASFRLELGFHIFRYIRVS